MNFKTLISVIFSIVFIFSNLSNVNAKYELKEFTDKNGYKYKAVPGDKMNVRIYTLKNGLTVYLSENKDEPRIQTIIAVKAGSKFDPPTTTGLAHYFEHLMFKGSDKIGTTNWQEEKKYLDEITELYEQHRNTSDPEKKKEIYRKIDSVSLIASKYAVANEYDKMVTALGAKGTNAFTGEERTAYLNDIPSNELERWLILERERFGYPALRLFHTELETVYEEFNMYQDMDAVRVEETLNAELFKFHPYGTQTTIGKPEHLKNPSIINIRNYFNTYYAPNNMVICLSGDLNYEETIKLIDKYFGDLKPSKLPEFKPPVEPPIEGPIVKEVFGPEPEWVTFAFRFGGVKSKDKLYVQLIDMILSNSKAGLIDLDLVQKQRVLEASSSFYAMNDYSIHSFEGKPRQGQTLEQVKDLLLYEIEKIKRGEFDEWLIKAVINDLKLQRMKTMESNRRAYMFLNAFVSDISWDQFLAEFDEMSKITKKDLMDFAQKNYKNNYVIVYKRIGKDENIVKVEKPQITAVELNRDNHSEFYKKFMEYKTPSLKPVFVDYEKEINKTELSKNVPFYYIKNTTNEIFYLYFLIDMGRFHNIKLPLAINYLNYIGTDKYSPEELQKEFYKYGLSFGVSSDDERSYIYISGLDESFEKGIDLILHFINHAKPDLKIYRDYVDGIIKERNDNKKEKFMIFRGAINYAQYGENNPFKYRLKEEELKSIDPAELTNLVKNLLNYKHYLFYYGPRDLNNAKNIIAKHHKPNPNLIDYPEPIRFKEVETNKKRVFVVDYDMVQAQIMMVGINGPFDKNLLVPARFFNEYFGMGLSSIVFQEIREARGLAYTAYAMYAIDSKPNRYKNYLLAFVGTQADKIKIATDAMLELLNNMPKAQIQFDATKDAILKKIESERIIKSNIFWNYLSNKDRGINYDIRKDMYEQISKLDMNTFEQFFNKHIKDNNFTFVVMSKKDNLNRSILEQLGEIKELTLEEVFGY